MSAAHAFATNEGSKLRFPHVQKAVTAREKVIRNFTGQIMLIALTFIHVLMGMGV